VDGRGFDEFDLPSAYFGGALVIMICMISVVHFTTVNRNWRRWRKKFAMGL
jgi:hypothetical protein